MIQTAIGAPPRLCLPAHVPGLLTQARATAERVAKMEEAEKAKLGKQAEQKAQQARKRKAEAADAPEVV